MVGMKFNFVRAREPGVLYDEELQQWLKLWIFQMIFSSQLHGVNRLSLFRSTVYAHEHECALTSKFFLKHSQITLKIAYVDITLYPKENCTVVALVAMVCVSGYCGNWRVTFFVVM